MNTSMDNIIDKLNECNSEIELCALSQEFIDFCGYKYFNIIKAPQEFHHSIYDISMMSNWPLALVKTYDRANMLIDSPFAKRDTSAPIKPFLWTSKEMFNSHIESKDGEGKSLFKSNSMSRGVIFFVSVDSDSKGYVLLTGDEELKNETDFDRLQLVANALFAKAFELLGNIERTNSKLSKREHECLSWTSQGKTSFEIGMILGLSENTINNYLVTVGRKLGAVNRPHMVGIALRSGFI